MCSNAQAFLGPEVHVHQFPFLPQTRKHRATSHPLHQAVQRHLLRGEFVRVSAQRTKFVLPRVFFPAFLAFLSPPNCRRRRFSALFASQVLPPHFFSSRIAARGAETRPKCRDVRASRACRCSTHSKALFDPRFPSGSKGEGFGSERERLKGKVSFQTRSGSNRATTWDNQNVLAGFCSSKPRGYK